MLRIITPAVALVLCAAAVGPVQAQGTVEGLKQARAVRVTSGAIRVDGRLDDEAWRNATPTTDFVQVEPVEGAAPTDRMEVKFAFDDGALFIAARMFSSRTIQAPLSRRDDGEQAEYLQIELDTFLDRRTAYMFGVTAAGVRLDHYHAQDAENSFDAGFDPVWQAETEIDAQGWSAELWIPFSQLRFNELNEHVWGLNIKRWIPPLDEQVYWSPIGRTQRGWSSRFGELRGIDGVQPKARLELLPYVAGSSRVTGDRDLGNPFDDGRNLGQQVGADIKIGVGSALTLDAAVNPDFGQVEADPAEVNLTSFETFFSEKRPFFLEGQNRLSGPVNQFYYSRRIGAPPSGPAQGDYVDYPRTSTILGAAKLTGRLASGTSIGALAAFTDEEYARTAVGPLQSKVLVTPRTAWGVARVQQEFGREASTFGVGMVAMRRDLDPSDPLASLLSRTSIVGNVDTSLRFGNRTYEADFSLGIGRVAGEPAAIERVQRSAVHLFQVPDRPVVHLDATRRSLSGIHVLASIDKVAGRHWLWGTQVLIESPGFEPNDAGRLNFASDIRISSTRLVYRETQPGRYFRAYSFTVSADATPFWGFEPRARMFVDNRASLTFNNFWVSNVTYTRHFRGQDIQLTRGGPSMGTANGFELEGSLRNRTSSNTRWNASVYYRDNEQDDLQWGASGSLSFRPSPQWQLSVLPNYNNDNLNRQYVTQQANGRPETFGRRYVFAFIDRTTLSSQFRVSYTFKPDMTLDVYAEPFAASGRYDGFGELEAAKSSYLRVYGENGITIDRQPGDRYVVNDNGSTFNFTRSDFNIRSFRSNIVLRWEWRPGSTFFAVWQQDRASNVPQGDHVGPDDLFGSFSAPGDNIFLVKTTFWISR